MSENIEDIENTTKSDISFAPTFLDHRLSTGINFDGYCFIKRYIFISKKVINLYISYTLSPQLRNLNTNFTLGSFLFRSVKLAR